MNPMLAQADYPGWLPALFDRITTTLGLEVNWYEMGPLLLVLWAVILFTLIAIFAQAAVIYLVLMERKVLAWMTQRKGPNRVGPWGLLQTLADGVKLLFKEDIMTPQQDKFLFTLAPAVFFIPAFVFFALIPFTSELLAVALPAGLLFVFAISSISVVGIVLAGWASNNKYSLLGGMRSAAQAISYEIPLILSLLGIVLFTGTLNIRDIVLAQAGPFWNWFAILLTPVGFGIFAISALAEVNRIPFDLPEAESELVSGYNTEYTGMKFALFFLAEYAALFAMCALTVAFFFGGYFSPFGVFFIEMITGQQAAAMTGPIQLALQVEMLFWFMMKTYIFIFTAMWLRATLPRLKPDQLMGFSWKFLIPLCLINAFLIAGGKFAFLTQLAREGVRFDPAVPMLQYGTVFTTWAIWFVIALAVFWVFFYIMSRLLTEKLQARLAQR